MTFTEWRLRQLSNKVYKGVRLDFLRISILTANTASVWEYDEFVLGFLCARIAAALQYCGVSVMQQRDEILFVVLRRLLGRSPSVSIRSATMLDFTSHGLQFQDGVELARRLDGERVKRSRRGFVISNYFPRSLQLCGSCCLRLASK